MAITRIKNNQITDATIVASSKLVDYSITSTKIANNLTYGSDLTITGNLTVNGTATTIDTVNLVIEDPLILLSKNATGSPTADIGFIGERGDSTNIAFVWDESGSEFITAFTSSTETNTNITVSSYANFRTFDAAIGGNLAVTGTTAITGNVSVGNVIANGLVQGETVTATGNLTGGNANITNAVNSATLSVTGNANVGNLGTAGLITATGNITGGNLTTAGIVTATGNINGGNLNVQSGGVFGDTGYFTGNVDVLGNLNATVGVVYANSGIFLGDAVTGNNAAFAGIPGFTQLGSNVVMQFAGNVNSYSQLNFQNINNGTSASTDYIATADNGDDSNYYVNLGINSSTFDDPTYAGFFPNDSYLHNHGGNLILNPETTGKQIVMMVGGTDTANVVATVSETGMDVTGYTAVTGNITGGNLITTGLTSTATLSATGNANVGNLGTAGLIVATGNITGGNLTTAGQVDATGNITGGNLTTTGLTSTATLSATGNANVGNLGTAGQVTATGNITGGNIITAGIVTATGNVTGGNLVTTGLTKTGTLETSGDALIAGNLVVQGNLTYINIDDLRVEDPVIVLGTGPNGAPLTTDDGKDRGVFMEYYTTGIGNAFVGWDNSSGNMIISSDVSIANDVITVNSYGTLEAGNIYVESASISQTFTVTGNANVGNLGTAGLIVATGNITGGNLVTAGLTQSDTLAVTGNANVGNLGTAGLIVATGNITGGNLVTAGLTQSGTLNVTGNANVGNLGTTALVATGAITGSTTLDITSNANVGNLGTAGLIVATGNITGGNLVTAGLTQSGTLNVTGNANVGNLGTAALVATGAITGSTTLSITGNANVGNLGTAGLIVATGNITGGNLTTAGLTSTATLSATGNANVGNLGTAGLIVATGNIDGGNLNTAGQVVATGNITGGNITTAGRADLGNIVISGDEITGTNGRVNINEDQNDVDFSISGLAANVFYVDAAANSVSIGNSTQTTGAVLSINSTGSMLLPVGTTGQRPGTGVTGMIRFNTTSNQLEYYDSDDWTVAGTTFTVIASETFNGDGSTVAFTLSTAQTTASCIVSINGVVQIPTTAYSVSGTTLTFTEAPLSGDAIEVRQITTTSTITGVSNTPGTAIVQPNVTLGDVDITGNIVPIANATQNLGSASKYWKDLYLSGSTIYLGPLQLKAADANTFAVYKSDGTTQANLDVGAIDVSAIVSGTSAIGISGTGGNAYITVGGTANVLVASTTGANITGALGVTGNITGAYILGNGSQLTGIDATSIQNGTSNVRTVLNGNVTVSAAGTANVLVVTSTGANVAGTLDVTGNITGGNVSGTNISGTLLTAAQTNITSVGTLTSLAVAGNITPGGIAMSTGNATIGNLYVSGTTTIAGNIQQISGNSGQFFGNADTGFNALYAGLPAGFSILPQSVVNFVSEFNGYSQINNQNQSNGNEATVDWVLTGDNGSDSTYFLDIGYTGSGYDPAVAVLNNALGDVVTPGDAYIYTTGNVAGGDPSHLVMGTVDAGSYVRIFVGGPTAGNVAAQFNAPSQANTVTVSGGITVTGSASVSAITNGGANGAGNIGSSTGYFNTVFAKATSAQYADLAEVYESDADYEPGTVLVFGGDREVTVADQANDTRIAGVVSTNPSYLMNSAMTAQYTVAVALTGRVPTKVTGTVRKGDLMVSAGNGVAAANNQACLGSVIGKALENFDGDSGVIEIVVGRL